MTTEAKRLKHLIELLEDELHQSQRRQQALIVALSKARAELHAIEHGGIVFYDGDLIQG